MKIVRIVDQHLTLALDDACDIIDVWRPRRYHTPGSNVIQLDGVVAKPYGKSAINDGYYEADGLAVWRLLMWIMERKPKASPRATMNAFEALFADHPGDALRAVMRVFLGTWSAAPGEAHYFVDQLWNGHPREMSYIALAGILFERGYPKPDPEDDSLPG